MKFAVVLFAVFVSAHGRVISPRSYGGSEGGAYGGGGYGGGGMSGSYGGGYGSAATALRNSYNTGVDGYSINFGYDINDPYTYNVQSRRENGNPKDQVTGSYSLQEADGTMRTVNYVADWKNGFTATVTDKDGTRTYGAPSPYGDDSGYGDNSMGGGYEMSGGSGGYGGMGGGYGGMSGGYGGMSGGGMYGASVAKSGY